MQTYVQRLAWLRTRLAMVRTSHFAIGAGCACGLPGGHVDISAVETMIGSHLADKYSRSDQAQLAKLLARAKEQDGLNVLLGELIDGITVISDEDAAALCEDLELSVRSLDEVTGSKRRNAPRLESL